MFLTPLPPIPFWLCPSLLLTQINSKQLAPFSPTQGNRTMYLARTLQIDGARPAPHWGWDEWGQ